MTRRLWMRDRGGDSRRTRLRDHVVQGNREGVCDIQVGPAGCGAIGEIGRPVGVLQFVLAIGLGGEMDGDIRGVELDQKSDNASAEWK